MTSQHTVISGATGGMGRALALEFAASGQLLSLTGRDSGILETTAQLCRDRGAEVLTASIDVRDDRQLRFWVSERDDACPVDLVIACAGVSSSIKPDESGEHPDDVHRSFLVNTLGVVETITPLAERMRQRRKGQIAVLGSLAGLRGMPSSPSYSASKAGAMVYGEALRTWLAPYGVRVSVIAMGFVETPMSNRYQGDKPFMLSPEQAARRIRRGLERNQSRIEFPWLLALGTRLLNYIPLPLGDAIIRRYFGFTVTPDKDSHLRT